MCCKKRRLSAWCDQDIFRASRNTRLLLYPLGHGLAQLMHARDGGIAGVT